MDGIDSQVETICCDTAEDIDFDKKCIIVNKSYQFLDGEDIITDP